MFDIQKKMLAAFFSQKKKNYKEEGKDNNHAVFNHVHNMPCNKYPKLGQKEKLHKLGSMGISL